MPPKKKVKKCAKKITTEQRKRWRKEAEQREEERLVDVFAGLALMALILERKYVEPGFAAKEAYKFGTEMLKERRRLAGKKPN